VKVAIPVGSWRTRYVYHYAMVATRQLWVQRVVGPSLVVVGHLNPIVPRPGMPDRPAGGDAIAFVKSANAVPVRTLNVGPRNERAGGEPEAANLPVGRNTDLA